MRNKVAKNLEKLTTKEDIKPMMYPGRNPEKAMKRVWNNLTRKQRAERMRNAGL
jgi:hypothetical protein